MKNACILFAAVGVLSSVGLSMSQAATVTFREGIAISELGISSYSGTDNLTLISGTNAGRNYGSSNSLWGGQDTGGAQRRILLRFDVSALAAAAESITSATLTMTLVDQSGSNSGLVDVSMYEVASANAGWVQGSSSGAVETGASAWNYRSSTTTGWAGSAGLSTAGTDYVNSVIDSVKTVTTGASGVTGVQVTWTISADLIEQWMNGTNAGLLFVVSDPLGISNGDFFRFASDSYATAAYRPQLTVNYTPVPVPEPGSVVLLLAGAGLYGAMRYRRGQ